MVNDSTIAPAVQVRRPDTGDPWYIRWPLIGAVGLFLAVFVVAPVATVFVSAFEHGWPVLVAALTSADTLSAMRATLITATASVIANVVFGIAAAWAIARFRFPGKTLLTSLIDLPFSVSPVIAGLVFVLLFGAQGYLVGLVRATHIDIIFALPGIVLTTMFVTFPFVARELIPVMEALGPEEEEAALTLGANGRQMFWYVTLPNIKWGMLYGVLLCAARAVGEYGAVSVVSGKLRNTSTLPVHIDNLYNSLSATGMASAFAVAALLTCTALVTLVLKTFLEKKADTGAGRHVA